MKKMTRQAGRRGENTKKPTPKKPIKKVETKTPACDVCGGPLSEIHCRLICPHCGATRDCSDP